MEIFTVEGAPLNPASVPAKRFPGLDLMKLSFVVAIVIFHVWENFVYQDVMWRPEDQSFYSVYAIILPLFFHFAGPFLAGISFFLFGYHRSRFSRKKLIVFALGVLLIQYTDPSIDHFWQTNAWSWDVYSYLFVTYLVACLIPNSVVPQTGLVVIGLLALIPSSLFYSNLLSPFFDEWLSPRWPQALSIFLLKPGSSPPNGWFLIPWMFLPLALHGLGFLAREYETALKTLRVWEVILFGVAATIMLIKRTPITFFAGPRFYEFQFWQNSLYFWTHFTFFIFYVRLQFVQRLAPFFNSWILRQLSKLQWVQNLWLCYFFHFVILQTLLVRSAEINSTPFALDFAWMFIFLGTEIGMQIAFWIVKLQKKRRAVS